MTSWKILIAAVCCLSFTCKEQNMNNELFPQNPAVIPFAMGQIFHLFPVLRENSIGLVYGEQWAIAEVKEDNVELDVFPEEEFECSICKALNQKSNSMLFVRSPKSVLMLDWNSKKLEAEFMDFSKSSGIGIENTKVIDHSNGIVLSLFFHDDKNMDFHYYFVIDDIFNRKRLKEVPIPKHIPPLDFFLTPSFVFYQYVWEDFESPWIVLDNDLNETKHPLADLLNDYAKKMVFYASRDLVYISEPLEHALIIAYNQITKTDNLYLARWYKEPEIIPVPFDSF